jgi:hypothetical protein
MKLTKRMGWAVLAIGLGAACSPTPTETLEARRTTARVAAATPKARIPSRLRRPLYRPSPRRRRWRGRGGVRDSVCARRDGLGERGAAPWVAGGRPGRTTPGWPLGCGSAPSGLLPGWAATMVLVRLRRSRVRPGTPQESQPSPVERCSTPRWDVIAPERSSFSCRSTAWSTNTRSSGLQPSCTALARTSA